MSLNLIEQIQKNLQYPPLYKIDPNTGEIKGKEDEPSLQLLAQSAIPAVLTGLYRLSRNNKGCEEIIQLKSNYDSLAVLFGENEDQVVEKVTQYSGVSTNQAQSHLENIADESIKLINDQFRNTDHPEKLKQYMNDQRHNILVYLPESLSLGDLLEDNSLDDHTNKMEGPVSNFMHKIENKLSQGGE